VTFRWAHVLVSLAGASILGVVVYYFVAQRPHVTTFSATTPVEASTAPVFKVSFEPSSATGAITLSTNHAIHPCGDKPIFGGSSTVNCSAIDSDTTYVFTATVGSRTASTSFTVLVNPRITRFTATPVQPGTAPVLQLEFGPQDATGVISLSTSRAARPCGEGPIRAGSSTVTCSAIASEVNYVLTVTSRAGTRNAVTSVATVTNPEITTFEATSPIHSA